MRVIVNRIWKGHFGTGLVDTPSNFGVDGRAADQSGAARVPGAVASSTSGLSIKKLHREIMLSAVYQLSTDHDQAANFDKDSGNRLYWRADRHRMTAEQIRDSLLFVSGALDTKMGGPSTPLTPLVRPPHGLRQGQPLQARRLPAAVRLPEPEPLGREALHDQRAAAAAVLHEQRLHAAAGRAARAARGRRSRQPRADPEGVSPDLRARRRPMPEIERRPRRSSRASR